MTVGVVRARWYGWVAGATVVGSLLAVAPALPAGAAGVAPDDGTVASAESAALAEAERSGQRVEVASTRTEYSQTFATPQGTLVTDEYALAQWVRSPGGGWVDVDASLRPAGDGGWEPVAATARMRFSGGGQGPLASIGAGGASVGLAWPEVLPEPVVDGNVATYRDVVPFVDLQVVADVEGFTHLVVIRSPKALENPLLDGIELETHLSGASLRVNGGGGVEAVNTSGEVVLAGPAPMMWDSRGSAGGAASLEQVEKGEGSARAGAGGVGPQPRMAPVAVDVLAGKLRLTPHAGMLADPATVFPVYVDPTWIKVTGKRNAWSLLRKSFPNSSFFNPAMGSTASDDKTKGIVRAGYVEWDRVYRDRSLFDMSISAVRHKRVRKATFSLTQKWSYRGCGQTGPVIQLRRIDHFDSSTTWNTQPAWHAVQATSRKIRKHGYSGCPPGRVEFNVTDLVRSRASKGYPKLWVGLRAKDETTGSWTRFDRNAKVSMEYNTAPNAPGSLKVAGKKCATGSSRPYVTTDRPAFSARASDPDSGQQSLSTRVFWWRSGQSRDSDVSVVGSSANPGTVNTSSVPSSMALTHRQVYKYQARTYDGIDTTWSKVCEFRAWTVPPEPPSDVVSIDYPEYDPDDPGLGAGGVGLPGVVTVSPPAVRAGDVVGYAYTTDSGVSASQAPVASKATDGSATFTLRPRRDGLTVLRVWSKDVAGLFSTAVAYEFRVRPGQGPAAQWTFDDPAGPGVDVSGHGNGVSLFGDAAMAPGRASVGLAVDLDGSGDYAATTGQVMRPHPDTGAAVPVATNETLTVAAWVRLDTTDGNHRVAVSINDAIRFAIELSYEAGGRWRFAMRSGESTAIARVFSDTAAAADRWTHLAGTYDATTGELRLYVNGVLQTDSATLTTPIDATEPVQVGRRRWSGSFGEYFIGQVDDVRLYPYLVPVAELVDAARPLPPVVTFPSGDTAPVGGTVQVRFDAGGDSNVTEFRYSVGSDVLDQTVAASPAGGTATVNIPAAAVGEVEVFAAGVDRVSHVSESTSATATVTGDPEVSGVVFSNVTREPVAGATVMLDPTGLEVTTGADGSFAFVGFDAGVYTLAAQMGGQCGMAAATEIEITVPEVVELWLTPATDVFGYECQEAPGTQFAPVGGAAIALAGDNSVEQVNLPFAFPFYGENYSSAWVDTNGVVSFQDPGGSHVYDGRNLPASAPPGALVAPYWSDLVVDSSASVHTELVGVAPRRLFMIEWRNVHLAGDTSARLSVQVTFAEDGLIMVNYSGLDSAAERGLDAVVGIESPGGQVGVQYAYKQAVLASDSMIVFVYPLDPNQISTVTLSGTVVDTDGLPAAGVQVELDPAEVSVTTGADGGFVFDDLESGSYLVEAAAGERCAKWGQQLVELDTSMQVQVGLAPAGDEYGYTCTTGAQGFAPVDTQLALSGDDSNEAVSLPFPIDLYGETHTDVWVNTNGILLFQPQPFPWWAVYQIPSVHNSPSSAIYPFWSDWVVDSSASVWTGVNGTAPDRRFVVEWRNVAHAENGSARVSFQAVLHEATGEIGVAWDGIGSIALEQGSKGVVGIENTDGTVALPFAMLEEVLASGQGVLFHPGDAGLHVVTGEVTCAGTPASGVRVWLADQTTTTDPDGGFELAGLPAGPLGLVATAQAGDCAGSVVVPVTAVRGEPQQVDVELVEVSQAAGYTVTVADTAMLAAPNVVSLPGYDAGDDEYMQITPPFPLQVYGQSYSTAWLDTNGYLMFEDRGFADALPFPIPHPEYSPDAAVYPLWGDWVVDSVASVRTGLHGVAPNRKWVLEWRDVHPFNMWQRVSFQIVFDEATGQITLAYDNIGSTFVERGGAGLTGVENADGTVAVQFSYLAPVLRTGRGVIFTPTP